jgi:hypothetical protein
MDVEVPSIAETQLTGKIGAAMLMRGRVSYRVNLVSGRCPICLYDGRTVEPTHNATMLKLVKQARQFFNV